MANRLSGGVKAAVRKLPPPRDKAAEDLLRAMKRFVRGQAPAQPKPPRKAQPPLDVRLERAYASGKKSRVRAVLDELHDLQTRAERLATPSTISDTARLSETRGVKSTQYMVDLLPHLQRTLAAELPRGRSLKVLDVGPGTGHGTALLANLYKRGTLGYRMQVTALDIVDDYQHYINTVAPNVRFIRDDLYTHGRTYDIVVSSHVIEHVPDPVRFCRRMQELARVAVFVSAPYNEPAENITAGHVNIIDETLVKELDADEVTVMKSVSWGAFKNPPYDSVIARLPGLAPSPDPA